jgi:hypothetical protein
MELAAREEEREQRRQTEVPKSQFINRVNSYGPVKNAWSVAYGLNDRVIARYGLLKFSLDTAKGVVTFAADKTLPIVHKFDDQIAYADSVACRTLDNIENSIEKSKTVGKAAAIQDFLHITLEDTLGGVDHLVDTYLPANEDERRMENGSVLNGTATTVDRVKYVGGKLQSRLVSRTHLALSNASFALEWLEYLQKHANSTNVVIQARLVELRKKAVAIWNELSKDEPPKTDEQIAIALARLVALRLKKIYSQIPPLQPILSLAQSYIVDLFNHLSKVANLQGVNEYVLRQTREKINFVRSLIEALNSNVNKLK